MKRAIPGDELPYIHNTNTQLEHRFPVSMVTCDHYVDICLFINLLNSLGSDLKVLATAHPLYAEHAPGRPIDVYSTIQDLGIGSDLQTLDDLTRHYDVIQAEIAGWTAEHFFIAQQNRCLINVRRTMFWHVRSSEWRSPIHRQEGEVVFESPTHIHESSIDSLLSGKTEICELGPFDGTCGLPVFDPVV